MEWLRRHPYTFTIAIVGVVLIGGALFVESRSPVALSSQSMDTWGGGSFPAYQAPTTQQTPQQVAQDVIESQVPATLSLPPLSTSSPAAAPQSAQKNGFDYLAFLSQLSGAQPIPTSVNGTTSANAAITEAYEFIPTGLVATTAPAKKPMTPDQQALYDYGNEVGGEIQSFEELHTNEAQVLKDQAEDRSDPTKAAALVSLAQAFVSVGTYLQQMQDVPADVSSQHKALAQSYIDIGTKLQLVAQAKSDSDFIQAIETYDTTANMFVQNYGALAQFFSARGVVFAPQDPGSVFSFSGSGGGGL